jgi:hypothetical protein
MSEFSSVAKQIADVGRVSDELLARLTPIRAQTETHTEEKEQPDIEALQGWFELRMASQLSDKNRRDREQLATLCKAVGKFVGVQLKPLKEEIAALKLQVAELQAGGIKYSGALIKSMVVCRWLQASTCFGQ